MAKNNSGDGWGGWVMFASVMMMLTGFFQAIVGLTAILNDNFFVVTPNSLISVDVTTWGWVHLVLSLLVIFAGLAVLDGRVWARAIGVILAVVSAVANLAFVPYYPIWSILVITVDVLVIYALIVHGRSLAE